MKYLLLFLAIVTLSSAFLYRTS